MSVSVIARPSTLPVERYARQMPPIRRRICIDAAGESLDERLRRLRRERGLSQSGVAERAGLSLETVRGVEWRKHEPMASTVDAIASALDVSIDALWRGVQAS